MISILSKIPSGIGITLVAAMIISFFIVSPVNALPIESDDEVLNFSYTVKCFPMDMVLEHVVGAGLYPIMQWTSETHDDALAVLHVHPDTNKAIIIVLREDSTACVTEYGSSIRMWDSDLPDEDLEYDSEGYATSF